MPRVENIIRVMDSEISFVARATNKMHLYNLSKLLFYIKDKMVLNYLYTKYGSFVSSWIREYNYCGKPNNERIIWVCWLQGIESAPKIVKSCVESLIIHKGEAKVNIISFDNIAEFADIPHIVYEKLENRSLSYTHFSDIVRFAILSKHGGIWIDSTFFFTKDIPDNYFNYPFFSGGKRVEKKEREFVCVSKSRWITSFIGTAEINNSIMTFVRDFLLEYVKNNDCFIDYLLIDYMIYIAYVEIDCCRNDIETVPYNNTDFSWLYYHLNKIYDDNEWQIQNQKDTIAYKLSYKKKWKVSINGKKTYFGKLFDGE